MNRNHGPEKDRPKKQHPDQATLNTSRQARPATNLQEALSSRKGIGIFHSVREASQAGPESVGWVSIRLAESTWASARHRPARDHPHAPSAKTPSRHGNFRP